MCQKVGYCCKRLWEGQVPHESRNIKWEGKVPHDEMGWKGAPCEILCPIGMGDFNVQQNKQQTTGSVNASLKYMGCVVAPYLAA